MYFNEYSKTYSMTYVEKIINTLRQFISFVIPYIEKLINSLGTFISLMIPIMTILMIVIIVARYFFGIGLTGLQELVMYVHALIFLGCAGYVYYKDEHVRVDIVYRSASNKYKNRVDIVLGILFLLPLCFVIGYFSIEQVRMAWDIKEGSGEAGGLKFIYVQKTFILLFPITLVLTIIYKLMKRIWN